MMHLLMALLILGPDARAPKIEAQHCVISCKDFETYQKCWYELKYSCGRHAVCKDDAVTECVPWAVNLGEWSPTPKDYIPDPYDSTLYPK